MKRIVLSALMILTLSLTVSTGPALAAYATADAVINWDTLTFSSQITWDEQQSYVEIELDEGYSSQQSDGFVTLWQSDFDATTDVMASTMEGLDGAYVNAGANSYGYAYADLYGAFIPEHDMTITVSFDYDLFGDVAGGDAYSDSYVFLVLGNESYENALTLDVFGDTRTDEITGTASVTADLLAGQRYDFSMGASAEASAVPVPAAVWLLGSGLIGLVGLRRRA
jgi:hypothetical protein